jgi:hypothetical protein
MEEQVVIPGYVYHIKDSYFDLAKDDRLMRNHEGGAFRPTYLCLKFADADLLWAIPMSGRIEKYQPIVDKDTVRFGRCDKILIARYGEKQSAFLFQNMFPVIAEYIDHIHVIGGKAVPIEENVRREVEATFKECLRLHGRGVKIIFTDINRLKELMLNEIRRNREGAKSNRPKASEESTAHKTPAEKPGILGEGGTLAAAKAEVERRSGEREKGKDDPAR